MRQKLNFDMSTVTAPPSFTGGAAWIMHQASAGCPSPVALHGQGDGGSEPMGSAQGAPPR